LPAVLRINEQKVIGSLSLSLELPYVIGVRIDRDCLRLGFFRKVSGHATYRSSFIAYLPGELAPAAGSGSGATLSELEIQAFRYEVIDESGYLEDETRTALRTTKARIDTDVLVQMTVLCARHGLPEDMKEPEWKTLDADLWRNLDEMPHENYVLTIWCLVNRLSDKIQTLTNFESSIEDHVHRIRNVSKPISQSLQALHVLSAKAIVQSSKNTSSETSEHLASRTLLAESRRFMEEAEGRDLKGVSSPADYPQVKATTSKGQKSSDSELQIEMQKLKKEIQRLRMVNQDLCSSIEQKTEDWQGLRDKSNKNFNDFRRKVISHTQQQAEEIEQLRDVGRFWLGLERLRHQKIQQFFEGHLPRDDIVFQLAESLEKH